MNPEEFVQSQALHLKGNESTDIGTDGGTRPQGPGAERCRWQLRLFKGSKLFRSSQLFSNRSGKMSWSTTTAEALR